MVDLRKAKEQSADLGEVLARTQGVSVRRTGGLGSGAVLALNGLQGDQVRIFVDGVPIELSGFSTGIANIPVNIVERVEIYRGVVPARFGLDALGGVINVITTRKTRSFLEASYQVASFGIHRGTLAGRYQDAGYFVNVNGYADLAQNSYLMSDRALSTPDGQSTVKDVRRFHDGYHGYGTRLELGVVDKPWADRFLVRGVGSTYDRDIQTNPVMSVPYGEVTRSETTLGAAIEYEVSLWPDLELELLANYSYREIGFQDLSSDRYGWDGAILRALGSGGVPRQGEIGNEPTDNISYENRLFSRLGLIAHLGPLQTARLFVTPSYATRRTRDLLEGKKNWNLADNTLGVVTGLEYGLSLFDDRLSNVVLAKHYYFRSEAEDLQDIEGIEPYVFSTANTVHAFGAGDSLRVRITDYLLAKASYEYAVRLPNVDEIFGDGALVARNSDLKPERSHNLNLGPRLEINRTPIGDWVVDINGFWRATQDQIVFIPSETRTPYSNISDTLSKGVEGSIFWQSPGKWVALNGSATWMDQRNESKDGPFSAFTGQRIPSRPYRFASWGGRLHTAHVPKIEDTLDLFYHGRWVGGFYRGWATLGNPQYKMSVPSQVAHTIGLTYQRYFRKDLYSFTFEIDNLTDAQLFDLWGVQRPGRSFALKVSGQLRSQLNAKPTSRDP